MVVTAAHSTATGAAPRTLPARTMARGGGKNKKRKVVREEDSGDDAIGGGGVPTRDDANGDGAAPTVDDGNGDGAMIAVPTCADTGTLIAVPTTPPHQTKTTTATEVGQRACTADEGSGPGHATVEKVDAPADGSRNNGGMPGV